MTYLAVCFFFSFCCLVPSTVQSWMVPAYRHSLNGESLQRLSEGVNRTYYDNIVASVKELGVNLTFNKEGVHRLYYDNILTSIKKLGLNLTFDKEILSQTRRAHRFIAHHFPSNEIGIERNVYTVKRVTRREESYPTACSSRGEPQGKEVPCKENAEGVFTCTQVVPVNPHGVRPVKIVLATEYRSLSALEKKGSLCVYEVRHVLTTVPENPKNCSLQTTDFLDEQLHSIVKKFSEVHILAEVDSRQAVGVVTVDGNCQRNRSANQDCGALLRPYDDAYQKSAILLQMALIPLIERNTTSFSDDIYSLAGMRKRTFPNLLLQWQTMNVLHLAYTGLSFIDDDYFKGVPNLKFLALSGNNLTAVPDGIKQLRGLEVLDLSNNPLKNMTHLSDVLRSLTALKRLDLSDVPIGRLDPLHDGLTAIKLRSLKMRRSLDSVMSKATMDIFKSMTKLELLDLSENPLYFIDEDLFSNMQAIQQLHLSNTNLSQSFKLRLNPTEYVRFIDLSHNQLTKINTIETCGHVLMLKIDHNFIEEWADPDVFISSCKRPWVEYLNVSYNNIKQVSVPMMLSLRVIREVDIGHNPIECNCDIKERNWPKETRGCVSSPDFKCIPIEMCVNKKGNYISSVYWYLLIPLVMLVIMIAFIRILTSFRRYQIAYLEYLDKRRKENRKKAVGLSKVVFKNDVYIVHSLEDTDWVNTVLLPRLQNYRVVVGDPNGNDMERIGDNIQNSRHLLFVVTDTFSQSEHCMQRGLSMGNFSILNGEEHNLIFLMMHGVNRQAFPTNLKLLSSTYDCIDWPEEGKSDAKAFKTLTFYLGTSTNHTWKINFKK